MNHRLLIALPLAGLGALLLLLSAPGCGGSARVPTRTIRTPEPGMADQALYTSTTTTRQLPAGEPILATDFQLRPFRQWSESQAAADALGRIGPPAVPDLIAALQSTDPEVRLQAAQVLARMGSDARDAVPYLIRLLDDPDERIRKTAARTLGRVGPDAAPAVPALMRSLLQPTPAPPQQ
jgi:hypothetical protein